MWYAIGLILVFNLGIAVWYYGYRWLLLHLCLKIQQLEQKVKKQDSLISSLRYAVDERDKIDEDWSMN